MQRPIAFERPKEENIVESRIEILVELAGTGGDAEQLGIPLQLGFSAQRLPLGGISRRY